jgi:hypothetical protein
MVWLQAPVPDDEPDATPKKVPIRLSNSTAMRRSLAPMNKSGGKISNKPAPRLVGYQKPLPIFSDTDRYVLFGVGICA